MSTPAKSRDSAGEPYANACAVHLLMRADPTALADCRRFCRDADTVVLLDAGVVALALDDWRDGFTGGVAFACLEADALAHGMAEIAAEQGVRLLGDADLVRLVIDSRHCLSWK